MIIRAAAFEDLGFVQDCVRTAYSRYIPLIGKEPAPMVVDYRHEIDRGRVFIAPQRGMIVFYPKGRAMMLETVAVDPKHHGKGIGKALIYFCEKMAREKSLERVRLYTNVKMAANLTLYPHLGYVETERKTEDRFERIYFEKDLQRVTE